VEAARQCGRNAGRDAEHVGSLVVREGQVFLARHIRHLLQGQAEFTNIDELGDQNWVLGRQAIIQAHQQASQVPADLPFQRDTVFACTETARTLDRRLSQQDIDGDFTSPSVLRVGVLSG
jgi:hypothetical protein